MRAMRMQRLARAATGAASTLMALAMLAASAWAAPPTVVDTLEHRMTGLGKTRLRDHSFSAINTPKLSLHLEPSKKLMVVSYGLLNQRGFRLGANNKLSATDRRELESLLTRHAPSIDSRIVMRNLIVETKRNKIYRQQLNGMDGVIDNLLGRAASIKGTQEEQLWKQNNATLYFDPARSVLVGVKGFSQKGFFLSKGKDKLELQSPYREELRQFLLEHSAAK
jgi:hypothetical protein